MTFCIYTAEGNYLTGTARGTTAKEAIEGCVTGAYASLFPAGLYMVVPYQHGAGPARLFRLEAPSPPPVLVATEVRNK